MGHAKEDLSKLVAQSIWAALPDQSPEFIATLIRGMQESKTTPIEGVANLQFGPKTATETELFECYEEETLAQEDLLIKGQIEEADLFFKTLRKREDLHEVVPNELYYRIIEKKEGKKITSTSFEVLASYRIETLDKTLVFTPNLAEERPLPLSGLLPGLAKGMLGMNEGEKREIFIHPRYSCSRLGFLEGHPALIVEVKLESISENKELEFPIEPIEISVSNVSKKDLESKYRSAHLKLAYLYGKAVWEHYKWGNYSLEAVVDNINKASKGDVMDLSSSSLQKKLVDLHWSIYQQQEKSLGERACNH